MEKDEQIKQITALTAPKHVKIYKLSETGMPSSQIAAILGTNAGHVWNVLKSYKDSPEKAEKANQICTGP
jgi:transcriptional regulator